MFMNISYNVLRLLKFINIFKDLFLISIPHTFKNINNLFRKSETFSDPSIQRYASH